MPATPLVKHFLEQRTDLIILIVDFLHSTRTRSDHVGTAISLRLSATLPRPPRQVHATFSTTSRGQSGQLRRRLLSYSFHVDRNSSTTIRAMEDLPTAAESALEGKGPLRRSDGDD